jgi:hypothetical protein
MLVPMWMCVTETELSVYVCELHKEVKNAFAWKQSHTCATDGKQGAIQLSSLFSTVARVSVCC